MDRVTVLYIYDYEGWAIHNVGTLWLNDVPGLAVFFVKAGDLKKLDFKKYDVLWFGYLDLFLHCYSRYYLSVEDLNRCIVSIHDPAELFPEREDWKRISIGLDRWWLPSAWYRYIRFRILCHASCIVTTSAEMRVLIHEMGLEPFLIPTTSSLPMRDRYGLTTQKCSALSVFQVRPRKDVRLMESLQTYCGDILRLQFETKVGRTILPVDQYVDLLDQHEIYICTSYQEGGPIPAMDAMRRGSVVLSTRVGQIQDIIKNGENGYLCETEEEFATKIELLSSDLALLHSMRLRSLETSSEVGKIGDIKTEVAAVISALRSINELPASRKEGKILRLVIWVFDCIVYVSSKIAHGLWSKMGGRASAW